MSRDGTTAESNAPGDFRCRLKVVIGVGRVPKNSYEREITFIFGAREWKS